MQKKKYGMVVIGCLRGTNQTEAFHKGTVTTFGTWTTGIEMSDCLLTKRRHRQNHRTSELRRPYFPKIGHVNTWLIDSLQLLVWINHGIQFYSGWSNPSDYRETDESFDTLALHTSALHDALMEQWENKIDQSAVHQSWDQQYLSDAMGVKLLFLPLFQEREHSI